MLPKCRLSQGRCLKSFPRQKAISIGTTSKSIAEARVCPTTPMSSAGSISSWHSSTRWMKRHNPPGCCEVVSGASCPSRGKCSSGPSIHQKPAIWRLWVDISLLHLGTRQLLFPLGCCVGLGLWWQCVVNFEVEGKSHLKPLLKSLKSHRIATNTLGYLESYEWKGTIRSGKVEPGDSHLEMTNHLHCDNGCVRKWSGFAQSTLWNVVNSHDSTPSPHRRLPEKSAKKGSKSLKMPMV